MLGPVCFLPACRNCESLLQSMENKLMYSLTLAEAHFAFGGMHVHVYLFWRQFEEQHEGRMALVVQDVLIRLA